MEWKIPKEPIEIGYIEKVPFRESTASPAIIDMFCMVCHHEFGKLEKFVLALGEYKVCMECAIPEDIIPKEGNE